MVASRSGRAPILWLSLIAIVISAAGEAAAVGGVESGSPWIAIAPGMEFGRFQGDWPTPVSDTTITILRIDPHQWDLRLFSVSELGSAVTDRSHNKTARAWCAEHGLVVATNAGMFATDYRTHTGFMRSASHVNSAGQNHYKSVAAFHPIDPADVPFRIFDLDVEGQGFDTVASRYRSLVQNLRLIKHPGENRWQQQPKMWSEMALAEDDSGRMLLVFCRSPFSMHDFNNILLSLPIDIVAAQHLEGGPEAQLYIGLKGFEREFFGSYETGFRPDDSNDRAWAVPNVLGVVQRQTTGAAPDPD